MQTIYLAGGCLWGVQKFIRHLPGVVGTEAGRANGTSQTLDEAYDDYAECVKTQFDSSQVTLAQLLGYFFEIIDPCSVNQQGDDVGRKYRTGIYSTDTEHLAMARGFIKAQADSNNIRVEVLPLTNYVKSADEHQDRLSRCPEDYCHIPIAILHKYRVLPN